MAFLQPLGRALMLPIAVLPIAGLLLRLGQPDMVQLGLLSSTSASFLSAAGGVIFDQLGLMFAVGVALGFARDGNGAACLAGVTCYLVAAKSAEVLLPVPPGIGAGLSGEVRASLVATWQTAAIHRFDIPLGIASGLVGGNFYNRFATVSLPDFLAFFGGRRFVPIMSGIAGLMIAAVLGLANGMLNDAMDALSRGVVGSGYAGLFAFGVLNRLLIVTGLHHILNNVVWFLVGDWHGITGDLRRFFAGDPSAGTFMSGFFPVMMFGLPAACLAMYHEVSADRRNAFGGLYLSMALTSVLTGVTEPIEFSFMFCAPLLYGVHAALTGLAEVVMKLAGVRLGFSFSAGLIDYVLNYTKASRPLLLLPIGLVYALAYYGVFRFAIRRWNLPTPGREAGAAEDAPRKLEDKRGPAFVAALGGDRNLREVGACTTRLRLVIEDLQLIDESALRALGAMGVLKSPPNALQVVLGPIADAVAMDIQSVLGRESSGSPGFLSTSSGDSTNEDLPPPIARALGGTENVTAARLYPGRWRVELKNPQRVSVAALSVGSIRGVARPSANVIHVLVEELLEEAE